MAASEECVGGVVRVSLRGRGALPGDEIDRARDLVKKGAGFPEVCRGSVSAAGDAPVAFPAGTVLLGSREHERWLGASNWEFC